MSGWYGQRDVYGGDRIEAFPFSGVGFRERVFDVLYVLVGHCFGAGRKEWRKTFLEMGILLHPVSVLLLPVMLWTVPAAVDPSIAVHM